MDCKGIINQPKWQKKTCPYCHEKLGLPERLARNAKRVCKCKKCKKTIDERFVIH